MTYPKEYCVRMSSVPAMYEQYTGEVTVFACDEEEAASKALQKFKSTSFHNRNRALWRIDKITRRWN